MTPATLAAVDCVPVPPAGEAPRRRARRITRFAVLFSQRRGPEVSAALAALRFSKSESAAISTVVERWRTAGPSIEQVLSTNEPPDDGVVRRWVADIGRLNVPLVTRVGVALWDARRAAGGPAPERGAVRALYRRLWRSRFRDPVELSDLAIDGDDLRRAGIPPGPQLGKILHALLGRVIRDPSLNAPAWLVEEAKRLYAGGDHGGGSPDTTRGR